MKQFLTLAALFVMTFTAVAQPPMGQGPKGREFPQDGPKFERQDPAEVAQKQTDQMDKLVTLTPKQYKKIYKFNKRQAETRQTEMESMRPEGFPGGMGPGGFPPRDGEFRRGPGPRGEEMKALMEEQQAERVKKYRKILTPEQFQKWESFEAQREFRQMIENPEK